MTLGFRLPAVNIRWRDMLFCFGEPPYDTSQIEGVIYSVFQEKQNREPDNDELERVRLLFSQGVMNRIKIKNIMCAKIRVARKVV
jgi:hypothetical protein